MPLSVLLVLVDRQILAAASTEQGLVHLGHVLEEPLDVAPLAAQLALLAHLAGLDAARVVELHPGLQTRGRDGRLSEGKIASF